MSLPPALELPFIAGLPLFLYLMFFGPLLLLVLLAVAFGGPRRWAKVITTLWSLGCLPAALLITMGYAFNPSSSWNPLILLPLWYGAGIARTSAAIEPRKREIALADLKELKAAK
jgi:hypothetical protein